MKVLDKSRRTADGVVHEIDGYKQCRKTPERGERHVKRQHERSDGMDPCACSMVQPGADVLVRVFVGRTCSEGMVEQQRLERQRQQYVGGEEPPPAYPYGELPHRHCGHQPKNSKAWPSTANFVCCSTSSVNFFKGHNSKSTMRPQPRH